MVRFVELVAALVPQGRAREFQGRDDEMRFAAGLTISGILGFLLLEALKIVMVPVTAWIMSLLALALKIVLILLVVLAAAAVIGIGLFIYNRQKKAAGEA